MTSLESDAGRAERMPWRTTLLLGLGSFTIGAVSPLYDSYVPGLLEHVLRRSAAVGAMMGLDNVLGLFLIPLFGALSDRTRTRLGRRVPFVLVGLPVAALGLATIPVAAMRGFAPLFAAVVVFQVANLAMRAPFQALLHDLIASQHRTRAYSIMSMLMCVGAMSILMGAMSLYPIDPRLPFALAGAAGLAVAVIYAFCLREPPLPNNPLPAPVELDLSGAWAAVRSIPRQRGVRCYFLGCLCFHMGFQSLSSWFTTYGQERFGRPLNECSTGFIALAIATLVGSYPAGVLGSRHGRRRCAVIGTAAMSAVAVLLHFAVTLEQARLLLFLFGVCWALPVVNLFPMSLEMGGARAAGTFAGLFFVCQGAAGLLGPAAAGVAFDIMDTKRPLFVLIGTSLAIACAFFAALPRGLGEARETQRTGPNGHRSNETG